MGFLIISALFVVVAIIFALSGIKLLFKKNWLLGWLRGNLGFVLLFCVFVLGSIAYDVYSYKQLVPQKNIATISFVSLGEQHYAANFTENGKDQVNFELYGDQWQLDSRMIEWKGFLTGVGLKPGYRLERISGRYLLLDDERLKKRITHSISSKSNVFDIWKWFNDNENNLLVNARFGNSTFLPMVDGGQYQISLAESGLLVQPLNQPAIDAVAQWR